MRPGNVCFANFLFQCNPFLRSSEFSLLSLKLDMVWYDFTMVFLREQEAPQVFWRLMIDFAMKNPIRTGSKDKKVVTSHFWAH